MNILWITPKPLPEIEKALHISHSPMGGWLIGISEEILKHHENRLGICFQGDKLCEGMTPNIKYYMIPKYPEFRVSTDEQKQEIIRIVDDFKPDVITVFGTEHFFQSEILKTLNETKYANITSVWIQGLVGIYAGHYTAGLPKKIVNRITLKECLTRYTTKKDINSFIIRGRNEKAALEKVRNVFGRTNWDLAIVRQYNPQAHYYFCNETLRDSFYNCIWDLEKCERYSLFVSQCQTPIKGFHRVLEALTELKKKYPEVHLYTTGRNLSTPTWKEQLRFGSYQKYLYEIIKANQLQNNVTFLGSLSEEQMRERYLKSHVFISASSIENSPNSLGEAMLLGVPTVSSYVGGVANMLIDGEEGFLYQADAPYMLSYYVDRIFSDDQLAISFSEKSREHATHTHSREQNYATLMKGYRTIAEGRDSE